jgi:hypothetical protein
MRRFIAASILFLLCTPMLAQHGGMCVSIEPVSQELPAEIRIQAAASIGTNTLVVWGGNRAYGQDTAISNLQGQILRGTATEGSPVQLHSDAARPFGYVSVVPFDDRYLVLWNDRRAVEPGLYMQWIDDDGTPLEEEKIFSRIHATPTSLMVFRTSQQVLIFHENRSAPLPVGLYVRRFTHGGNPVAPDALVVEGTRTVVERLADFGDLFVVISGASMRILRADGSFESRSIPAGRFDHPWYLGADSLFVTLVDTTLHYYSSIFEPEPFRSIGISELHPIEGRRAVLGSRDNDIRITYPAGGLLDAPSTYIVRMQARQIVVSADGTVSPAIALDSMISYHGSGYYNTAELQSVTTERRCGNSSLISITYKVVNYNTRNIITGMSYPEWGFLVTARGEVHSAERGVPPNPCFDPTDALVQHAVLRTSFTATSSAGVVTRELPIVTSTIHDVAIPVDQSMPHIFRSGDRLMTTWKQGGAFTANILAAWMPERNETAMVAPLATAVAPLRMHTTTGLFLSEQYEAQGSGSPPRRFYRTTLQLAGLGWTAAMSDDRSDLQPTITTTGDPNRNESLALVYLPQYYHLYKAYWIDSNSRLVRTMDLPPGLKSSIAVAADSGVLLYNSERKRFIEVRAGKAVDSFDLDLREVPGTIVRRLYGSRFLVFSPASGAANPRLEIYSLQGNRENEAAIPIGNSYSDIFIVESPADYSIHILRTTGTDIRLVRLDRNLRIIGSDLSIAHSSGMVSSPAGAFSHDTLFVVWEDSRNATRDIYGTATVDGRIVVPENSVRIASVRPNPANNTATFLVELDRPGDLAAEIHDMTGQVLIRAEKRFDGRSGLWDIDITDLTNGIYLLAVRSDSGIGTQKLVVMKR